jgi:hypothetical protein
MHLVATLLEQGAGLFRDLHNHTKFEVSGITRYKGEYVMVFDSLMELGFVDATLEVFGDQNYLAGNAGDDSEYEGITHRTRTGTDSVWCMLLLFCSRFVA